MSGRSERNRYTMNVLIVDDDIPYLRSIRDNIHWKELAVENVYTASGMSGAVSQLTSKKIDLLITDIEMPGKSGLNLIDWCRKEKLPCTVIILSSFPDFEYAQQAISLGVFAYLLKSADQEMLENMIRRAITQIRQKQRQSDMPAGEKKTAQIEKIQFYISEHITEEISRDALAAYVGFTPEYLSSYYKKETGVSLNNYISSEKIRFAQTMLCQTDLPVSVIAQNLGFETSSYFAALFRKNVGMTPREYRKKMEEA